MTFLFRYDTRFIAQVVTGENTARRAEDIGGQELSYAEVKAIASGNPAVLTLAQADAELQRLALLKKNHLDEQFVARRRVRNLPETIASLSDRLAKLSADRATAAAHAGDAIRIGERSYPQREALDVLGGTLDDLPKLVGETTRIPLGTYHGLGFGMILRPQFPPDVYLEGRSLRQSQCGRDRPGPRAVLNELERLAYSYGPACDGARQDLSIAESQLRDYQVQLGRPFVHDGYMTELAGLRDRLKAGLSGAAREPGKDAGPTVAELSAAIKQMTAAHGVDAAPERTRQKPVAAEESVTTRIRRRRGALTTSHATAELSPDARADGFTTLPEPNPTPLSQALSGRNRKASSDAKSR